jgi:hypothetical protein
MHTAVKKNVLQALIEAAKVAYAEKDPGILSYILDDMSIKQFQIDHELLSNSTIGIFVTNAAKAEESKELIRQLAHAAMQNDKADLSDVISVIRQESTQEAEEILRASETKRVEREEKAQQQQAQMAKEAQQAAADLEEKRHQNDLEKITLQEKLKTEREIQKQTILSLGFNENKDMDDDGVPDILEVAKHGVDVEIKRKQLDLDRDKLSHQKVVDKEKLKIEAKKAEKAKN